MKRIEIHNIVEDKAKWAPGPWHDEPDKVQWQDEATELPCLVLRNHHGTWCGYVGVAEGHPYFGVPYNAYDSDDNPDISDLTVHGGLTFSDFCDPRGKADPAGQYICHLVEPGENDRVWWLGFDCGHGGDVSPAINYKFRDTPYSDETYRTLDYVTAQTEQLAKQLREVA